MKRKFAVACKIERHFPYPNSIDFHQEHYDLDPGYLC